MKDLTLRPAAAADAEAVHALVSAHLKEGHLLPRGLDEIRRHAARFLVCEQRGEVKACAELAPLSSATGEVRSLVVAGHFRRSGVAARLLDALRERAKAAGLNTLCAFTHDPRFFVRQGFSIVPHLWVPEKISTDCVECPLFRRCEQFAMILPLHAVARYGASAARAAVA